LLRRLRADDGVTLAELTVTMVVMAMLVSCVILMVTSSQKVAAGVKERLNQANSSTIAMERISRNLRTAVLQAQLSGCTTSACIDSAFLKGTPTTVSFYADVDNPKNAVGPSRVTYDVAGGVLTETVQKPDSPVPDATGYHYCTAGTAGCVVRLTVLATGVLTTKPVFAYYNANSPTTSLVMGGTGQLDADQLKSVDSVDVQLQVQQPGGANVGAATMILRVALPNHDNLPTADGSAP
jgi:Tfp pilus assembly protein PilW